MFPTKEVSRKIEEVPYTGGTVNGITKHSKGLSLTKENIKVKLTSTLPYDFPIALTERIGKDLIHSTTGYDKINEFPQNSILLIKDGLIAKITDEDDEEVGRIEAQCLTPGVTIEEFLSYLNSGSIQLSEIKVEVQNNPLQTTQNFQVSTWRPWKRPAPQILNVSALKNQDSENRYVVGPFEVPGSCVLSYRTNLEYTVLAAGDEPNVVIIDLFFANDTEHGDIARNLLAQ